MDIAPRTDFPELWAGMGRAVKAFVNCAIAIPSAVLFGAAGYGWVVYVNVATLMLIVVYRARIPLQADERTETENFELLHNLADKEKEVLAALLSGSGKKTKELAEGLAMSERSFQRHLGTIYAKTGVKTRTELVVVYHK